MSLVVRLWSNSILCILVMRTPALLLVVKFRITISDANTTNTSPTVRVIVLTLGLQNFTSPFLLVIIHSTYCLRFDSSTLRSADSISSSLIRTYHNKITSVLWSSSNKQANQPREPIDAFTFANAWVSLTEKYSPVQMCAHTHRQYRPIRCSYFCCPLNPWIM